MKNRYPSDCMAREFRFLRTRIEAEVSTPAILLVTSASDRDGAGLTAFGLAEALGNSHQRVVLVTSDPPPRRPFGPVRNGEPQKPWGRRENDGPERNWGPKSDDGTFSVISMSAERLATLSRSRVETLMERLRGENEYVVVDAGDLPKNSFGLLLLSRVDGALVTFRAGRSELPADRSTIDTLERSNVRLLGVVMTEEAAIKQYAHRDESAANAEWAPRRSPLGAGERLNVDLSRAGKIS